MKTAISASENNLKAKIDSRFARCPFFAIYDSETKQTTFIDNIHKDGQGGVGPMAVNLLVDNNVNKVVAIEYGPKAKDMLDSLKIQTIVFTDTNKTIEEIIKLMES